jgi:hypothetical protein
MKQIPLVLWLLGFPTLWHLTGGFPEIFFNNTGPETSTGIFWVVYIIGSFMINNDS